MLVAVALLAACKNKTSKDFEVVNTSSLADSVRMADRLSGSAADTTGLLSEKLIKTAEINIKVKDVRQTGEGIATLTKEFGGIVTHHQIQSSAGSSRDVHISNDSIMRIATFSTTGGMTVRVPSDKLVDYMTRVSYMGLFVNVLRMDIEDKSLDYLSAQLKLKERQELVSQQKAGKIRIKNPTDVLLLKDDMVDKKIENMRTDAAVKFSVVNLNFYQSDTILKEIIANDNPSAYNIPFLQRLGLALADGWSIFVDIVVGLANLWMFILLSLGVWLGVVYYRRKMRTVSKPAAS